MIIAEELLDILVCPLCRRGFDPPDSASFLICNRCGLAYPVRDGIPVMRPSEAVPPISPVAPHGD